METQKQDCVYVCFCRRVGDGVAGLNVPVGMQAQASLDISGVVGGKGGGQKVRRERRDDPNEKGLCRHCESISFRKLC